MTKQYPGRGPQKLTPKQEELLAFVRTADDRWREAKLNAQIELRKLVQEKIDLHSAVRDQAVYDAIMGDVPKSRITQDGLRTGPNAVYEILERVSQKLEFTNVELATKPIQPYTWSERHLMPNGVNYWFLLVDGDDHYVDIPEPVQIQGAGYVYMHELSGGWTWPLGIPNSEAMKWAEENKPE